MSLSCIQPSYASLCMKIWRISVVGTVHRSSSFPSNLLFDVYGANQVQKVPISHKHWHRHKTHLFVLNFISHLYFSILQFYFYSFWCWNKSSLISVQNFHIKTLLRWRELNFVTAHFLPPTLVWHPRSGIPSEFLNETYPVKIRGMGLLYGENCMILTSTVFDWSPVWRTQTDWHTDRRWHIHAIAYMLSRVKIS